MILLEKIEVAKEIYKNLKKWNLANNSISKFFSENKDNKDLYVILIKVLMVDSLYKTNLKDQISVAEHIYKIDKLDEELDKGNPLVVNKISKWRNINLLSFASKFCHFHNKKAYPIYDKYVIIALKNLISEWKDNRTFSNFIEGINKFRKENNILSSKFEDMDKFLWLYGMLLRLDAGKTDINREIQAYYYSNRKLFDKLKE